MLNKKALAATAAAEALYVEDVFSTYLYTGNSTSGGTQIIANGIDLANEGGMIWIKGRSAASNNVLFDTVRGRGTSSSDNQALSSNLTSAQDLGTTSDFVEMFYEGGFAVTQGGTTTATRSTNYNGVTYASWTFRKAEKFFDVVTYTGDGSSARFINHNLGSAPGFIVVKRTDSTSDWYCYHTATTGIDNYLLLNTTAAKTFSAEFWGQGSPNTTQFGISSTINVNGGTYVAYLFAHDAGGFGDSGNDNVISCGSYTGNGSATGPVIDLGYEPQWVMVKRATVSTGSWEMFDSMRGFTMNADAVLRADTSGAEFSLQRINPTSTGFQLADSDGDVNANGSTYIYIAIRRGPMKTPEAGTEVFEPVAYTGNGSYPRTVGTLTSTDLAINMARGVAGDVPVWIDRLRGGSSFLYSSGTAAESSLTGWKLEQTGQIINSDRNTNSTTYVDWQLRRAPGFMDVVCYTGTGSAMTVTHNLGVAPELMIVKRRDSTGDWRVTTNFINRGLLNDPAAFTNDAEFWNYGSPTSSTFPIGTNASINASGGTYVAYLFASVAGVSKVGSYTGTGTTLQINCGFTGGARFVLIKRTDSTGDWYAWDTARGIVSGNDPYLLLNSTAAEVTNTDYIDTYSSGFEISSTAPAAINANGGTFIFLAIA